MTEQEIIRILEESGALLTGHFQLRSGLHSNRFFQAALLLQYPDKAETVCRFLAEQYKNEKIDAVISPAVGGLIVGQEVARALGCRAIFADKEDGQLVLKRGFSIKPGDRILVAEDVVTKGGRVQQTIDLARSFGAEIVGIAVIVDRSGRRREIRRAVQERPETLPPDLRSGGMPMCKEGQAIDRPGSK